MDLVISLPLDYLTFAISLLIGPLAALYLPPYILFRLIQYKGAKMHELTVLGNH